MYKFRLQTALNVRERVEKLKQKAVAEQLKVVRRLKEEIQEMKFIAYPRHN